jgi:hypothetical protein
LLAPNLSSRHYFFLSSIDTLLLLFFFFPSSSFFVWKRKIEEESFSYFLKLRFYLFLLSIFRGSLNYDAFFLVRSERNFAFCLRNTNMKIYPFPIKFFFLSFFSFYLKTVSFFGFFHYYFLIPFAPKSA